MEQLQGTVERITYVSDESGYSVIKIRVKGYKNLVAVIGNMASVHMGAVITVKGKWTNSPQYGRQFEAENWKESVPATVQGIQRYLGSGLIKGVGPKYAKLIVDKFGEQTIDIIENNPNRLIEIENIGRGRMDAIKTAWQEQKHIKNVMLFLQEHGVSTALGHKIYKQYGDKSIDVMRENPYKLVDDVWGVGFQTADQIALKLGVNKESYNRCRTGIFYVLNRFANDGHCYALWDDLVKFSIEILNIEEPKIVMTLSHLIYEKELFREDENKIYLPPFYYAEKGVAWFVRDIISYKNNKPIIDNIKEKLRQLSSGIIYDNAQIKAITTAVSSKFCVLTGGPGTGKTTITKAIIELFQSVGKTVLLTAPTGRAAKRMSELCGLTAKTMHRLLEAKKDGFVKNADNPLVGDVIIIDESSMIDVLLMYNLLKDVPNHMTVIMVGDVDQLPSVGAGNVLRDIIKSEVTPVVKLTNIYRQARHSKIITNAHKINRGEMPDLTSDKSSDFFFIGEEDPSEIPQIICDLCSKRLPQHYKISSKDIQVLTPMQRSETGVVNLNHLLQDVINPGKVCLRHRGMEYHIEDKVMQVKNNYNNDKQVFNGDVGVVSAVDATNKILTVDFDGRHVKYEANELDELVLAYACTIHKSQGSEYPIVVIPLSMQHSVMLQRTLLYTGVTRAKQVLLLVGDKKAIKHAVKNNNVTKRNSDLTKWLRIKS